jgi:hypothetical protein
MEDCRGDANCKQNREKRYQLKCTQACAECANIYIMEYLWGV